MSESYLQAFLQIIYYWSQLYSGANLTKLQHTFQITSISISFLSLIYGVSTYSLRQILKREPKIQDIVLFTFTELTSTLNIFMLPIGYYYIFVVLTFGFGEDYILKIIIGIPVIFGLALLPVTVSTCLVSPRIKFQLYMLIDFRIYYSVVCKFTDSVRDLVRSRTIMLLVLMSYTLPFMAVTVYRGFANNHELNYWINIYRINREITKSEIALISCYLTIMLLSFVQSLVELFYICYKKKSFLNWVIIQSLKEETNALGDNCSKEIDAEDQHHDVKKNSDAVVEQVDVEKKSDVDYVDSDALVEHFDVDQMTVTLVEHIVVEKKSVTLDKHIVIEMESDAIVENIDVKKESDDLFEHIDVKEESDVEYVHSDSLFEDVYVEKKTVTLVEHIFVETKSITLVEQIVVEMEPDPLVEHVDVEQMTVTLVDYVFVKKKSVTLVEYIVVEMEPDAIVEHIDVKKELDALI